METVARHHMGVVLILTFFCMLFWAFFEQAGSSISNFTDRNVNRVFSRAGFHAVATSDVGKTIELEPTQEQLGYYNGKQRFTLDVLNKLREDHKNKLREDHKNKPRGDEHKQQDFTIAWQVTPETTWE